MSVKKPYSCYKNHPALDVGNGKVVYGGSCWEPVVRDADIYVGLDGTMEKHQLFPWRGQHQIRFLIIDHAAPVDAKEFKAMIAWLSEQIDAGKKVHIGCMGGHGRTGMVLAALVAHRKVSDDAIIYVRENYCNKAVESDEQVRFLVKHFKCKKAPPRDYGITHRRHNLDDDLHGGTKVFGEFTTDYSNGTKLVKISSALNRSDYYIDSGSPMRSPDKMIWSTNMIYKP